MSEEMGQSTNVVSNESNQSFTVPNSAGPSEDAASSLPALSDIIPSEYKDKPYFEKIKDIPGLFKSFDSAQELIGKRPAGIPQADAPAEEWNAFYKALGRPDTPEGYQIEMPKDLPKNLEVDDTHLGEFKSLAYELGLTPAQVEKLVNYDMARQSKALESINKQSEQSQQQINDEFDKMRTKLFGERADQAIENSRKLLAKYAPADFLDKIQGLDNNSLIALTSVLDGITNDYLSEDTPISGNNMPSTSKDELLADARKLMQSEAFRNPFNVEHDATQQKVKAIYEKIYA